MPKKPSQLPETHPLAIHCERHGVTAYCLLCRHLREESGLGYWAIKPEPEEPAHAWCEACDTVLDEEQGWSDRADEQADWKLYCAGCYQEALKRHVRRGSVAGS